MSKSVSEARKDFPLLSQKIEGRSFAYLDSAATTLKPWPVIERVSRFLTFETANVHRGAYRLSDKATQNFELVRVQVAQYIDAASENEILFTKGATEALNLIAHSWGRSHISEGEAIVVTQLEHHSNWVPWQQLCLQKGAHFLVVPVDASGNLDLACYQRYLEQYRVKLVSLTCLSNFPN